jgi:L-threonylcarbamoyladenylate synthase
MRNNDIEKAVEIINKGGVVISPTDTVYGLIADAANEKAVKKIFKIKKRPRSKPLAVFVSSIKQAKELAEISKEQEKILRKHWPGKYTFILKRKSSCEVGPRTISKLILGKGDTIGLRIPKYKLIIDLIKETGKPLAQTSANISGKPASTKIEEVLNQLKKSRVRPDLTLDVGDLPKSKPSAIINLTKGKTKILRK